MCLATGDFHGRGLSCYAMSFKKAGINDVEYLLQGRLALSDLDKLGIKQVMLALLPQGEPIPFPRINSETFALLGVAASSPSFRA